jgi:hypothetical protein
MFGGYFCVVITFFYFEVLFLVGGSLRKKNILSRNIYLEIREGIGKSVNCVIA